MTEPNRRSQSEDRSIPSEAYPMDVLLIADEPRRAAGEHANRPQSVEPLDMETVVRKLIAVLHEESGS